MSNLLGPADVERLARGLGLSMAEVCRRAGIATSIFTRWKSGLTRPGYRNYQRIMDAVQAGQSPPDTPPAVPPQPAANDTAKAKPRSRVCGPGVLTIGTDP
jgi:transcriptional regulator with XRE-family HTH domain